MVTAVEPATVTGNFRDDVNATVEAQVVARGLVTPIFGAVVNGGRMALPGFAGEIIFTVFPTVVPT